MDRERRKINVTLKNVLENRGISQKELKERIDTLYGVDGKIRAAAISELYNNQRKSINKEHLEKIVNALEIDNVSELLEIVKYKSDDAE